MLRSILCPVDFSEPSRHALRWAAAFAGRFQGRLIVLSVVDPLLAEAARIRLGQDLAKAEIEPALREFVAATVPKGTGASAEIVFRTRIGDPAAVIGEAAAADGIDTIVMGTQGLGGLRKWLLGSTTERVLRRTHVPVLAIPSGGEDPGAGDQAEIARILAATDLSESSEAAIRYASELARRLSATLTLAHAVEPLIVPEQWRSLVEQSDEARIADARARLNALAERFCASQPPDFVVAVGHPADVIGSTAQNLLADLIVMGLAASQRHFAARPGSIAYRVLCSATVPVLVVPPADVA
jgi:nucleotide-binding universal stress UspA family protein